MGKPWIMKSLPLRPAGVLLLCLLLVGAVMPFPASGQTAMPFPQVNIGLNQAEDPERVAVVLEIFLLLTVLSLAPAILVMVTSFTRLVVVLSILRQAMGTQQMPPNQVVIGLATSTAVLLALSGKRRARLIASVLGLAAQPAWFVAIQWPEQWGLMIASISCNAAWCAGVWMNRRMAR